MSRASVTTPRAFRLLVTTGAVAGALLLAGCGAGQQAQTSQQIAAVAGASGTVGDVVVSNAEIAYPGGPSPSAAVYPQGGTAPVDLTIVNQGEVTDRLVSASSPAGGSVLLLGDRELAPALAVVSGRQGDPAALPGTKRLTVAITGLREDVLSGRTYPLVLTFEKAGRLEFEIPVATSAAPRVDLAPEGTGGGH